VHTVDQALTFTSGQAKATINGKDQDVKAGDPVLVKDMANEIFSTRWNTASVCEHRKGAIGKNCVYATRTNSMRSPISCDC
jgi:hypothetical protein